MSGAEGQTGGWLPSLSLYQAKGEPLSMGDRWTPEGGSEQTGHFPVAVTRFTLISDNSVGIGNIDPSLEVFVGFTTAAYEDKQDDAPVNSRMADEFGFLRPVLGLDAYAAPEHDRY